MADRTYRGYADVVVEPMGGTLCDVYPVTETGEEFMADQWDISGPFPSADSLPIADVLDVLEATSEIRAFAIDRS